MERLPANSPYNRLAWLGCTFLYVFATNAMTLALAKEDARFQALWLSNAGLLTALLLAPLRYRLEIGFVAVCGFLLSALAFGGAPGSNGVLSLSYVIEALVAVWLIERTPGGRIDLTRLRGLSHFLLACMGGAPLSSFLLWFGWLAAHGQPVTLRHLIQWQVSHGLGLIVMTPMILAVYSRMVLGRNLRSAEIAEAVLHAVLLLAVSMAVFAQPLAILYLILPFLCLAAFRAGFLGSGLAVIVVAAVATIFTVHDLGPITHTSSDPVTRILLIQVFVACCSLTVLPICVVLTDRGRLVLSLSASERRFRELAEASPIGIFTIAPDLRITYANHQLAQIAQRPVETLLTERFGELLDPQTRQAIDVALQSCNSEWRIGEVAFGLQREDKEHWFQIHFAPMFDDDYAQIGWIGTVMDVSELRRSELRIARSEAELRLLADNANDMICRIDERGLILYASAASERLLDKARPDIVGRRLQDFAQATDRLPVMRAIDALASGSPSETRLFRWARAGADDLWVEAVFSGVDEAGGQRQLVVAITDISKRKADEAEILSANAQLRETNRLLQLAEGLAGLGHWSFDKAGQGSRWSDTFYKIHGLPPGQPLHLDRYLALVEPEQVATLRSAIATASERGDKFDVTFRIQRPDGEIRIVEVQGQGERDGNDKSSGVFGVCLDVTAHLAAQHELRVARDRAMSAVEARSRFLAVMSHEVRTPMTGVLATFELLARCSTHIDWPIPDMPRLIASTQSQARSLMMILNNVLDQAKLEAGRVELEAVEFDPSIVLADAVDLYLAQAEAKGLELRYDFGGPGIVTGDPGRLHQVVANLLSNALKFTPGGVIDLLCEDDDNGFYRVAVKDAGIGITQEAMASILEPFAQAERSTNRRFGGTGLGLSIVRDLVETMGGWLEIKSTPGLGSTFTIFLPKTCARQKPALAPRGESPAEARRPAAEALPAAPPALRPQSQPPATAELRGLRVLVVDDTDATRLAAQAQLHVLGCAPVGVAGGIDAIAQMLGGTFDLMLVDSAMPEMDGATTIRLVRLLPGQRGQVPILGFTAYSQGELQQDLLDEGAGGILVKPFSADTLRKAILDALEAGGKHNRPAFTISDMLESFPASMRHQLVAQVLRDLQRLKADITGPDCARAIHSVKGIAGSFGLDELERMCKFVESCPVHEATRALSLSALLDCIEQACSEVARLMKTTG